MSSVPLHSLFAAAGFGSAWMLFWGLTAAIPVLFHLWNRRQHQQMNWAAMRFLLAAVDKHARRVRIETLLLLAVRMGILGLMALALADPFWSYLAGVGAAGPLGNPIHNILVVDGSYSMGTRDEADTRFAQAKSLARSIVDHGSSGDGYSLLLMGDTTQSIIGQPAFEKAAMKDELDSLSLLHGGANLQAALNKSLELIAEREGAGTRLSDTHVYLLTDLGRSTWSAVETTPVSEAIHRLRERASITVIDFGRDDVDNSAVTSLISSAAIAVVNQPIDIRVNVQRFAGQLIAERQVELLVNDQRVNQRTVSLAAGRSVTVSFRHNFAAARDQRIEIRLAGDSLDIDDHRYLSVVVREATRVLCVYGKPTAADYVALALNPNKSNDAPIQTEIHSEVALTERELSEFDCVFLCNVGALAESDSRLLHEFVAHGGGLIIFLGDQVQSENYNARIGPTSADFPLLPVTLGEVVTGDQFHLDPRDYGHPIVDVFRGQETTGLLTTPIWSYIRLASDHNVNGGAATFKTAAWIANDPAIVSSVTGQGRVVLVATAASPKSMDNSSTPPMPWTALATWPSFPPLVHEMLSYASAGRHDNRNVLVGDTLRSDAGRRLASGPIISWEPGQQQRVALADDPNRGWSFDVIHTSGFYTAATQGNPPAIYAVNVDPRESDLRRIAPGELPPELNYQTATLDQQEREIATAGRAPSRGFRTILWLVLLLVGIESMLAWYFGRSIL